MTSLTQRFAYPLNVYAWLIEQECGTVEHLHYGLFERPDETAAVAQQRTADLLFAHLPPPCRVLDVGSGLGTTLARLLKAGYRAQGITPDAAQVETIRQRLGADAPIACSRLEDFAEGLGEWELLLFLESAQTIDGLDLFEAAGRLLGEAGEIVIMDEFAVRRDTPERVPLHYLPHFVAWAGRAGFTVQEQIDLTDRAAGTVDWLLAHTEAHAPTLRRALGLDETALPQLMQANREYQARYRDGRYGYFLLRLKRAARPRWLPRRIHAEDAPAMRALFADVFSQPMSAAHWHWKYGDGRGQGIGVWNREGRLVAHYGGTHRPILLFGQPALAFQGGDVMVAPAERGVLTRRGPAFLAMATFIEHEVGYGAPHLLGIGFPNATAYRLPERLGLYRGSLGRIQEVRWPALHERGSWRVRVREVAPAEASFAATVDACWQAMAASLLQYVVGVRDSAYVLHRYVRHPDKTYRFFLVRHRILGRPLGLLIVRKTDAASCELLDLIGPLANMRKLLHQARRVAAYLGCTVLHAWLVDNLLPIFDLPGKAQVIDLNVVVPGNGWTPGPDNALVAGKWWLTGGDTDFH